MRVIHGRGCVLSASFKNGHAAFAHMVAKDQLTLASHPNWRLWERFTNELYFESLAFSINSREKFKILNTLRALLDFYHTVFDKTNKCNYWQCSNTLSRLCKQFAYFVFNINDMKNIKHHYKDTQRHFNSFDYRWTNRLQINYKV